MTCDQIVSIDHIKAKARANFAAGRKRNEHGMNPWAPALKTWLAEWDRCKEFAESVADKGARP